MKLLEYFFRFPKADKPKDQVKEEEYIRGFDRGIEVGLRMASSVDRMALEMARTEGIDEVLRRFSESGNKTNS